MVPFSEIQLRIKVHAEQKYRVLLYKRFMLSLAQTIARKEGCAALATGDSLGQVSSQTLHNLSLVQGGIDLPILRPLIGMDKNEIIRLSKKAEFFTTSIRPQEDCCTLFVSAHQTAEGKREVIERIEKKLHLTPLLKKAVQDAVIYSTPF
jgi:thiamine biosynthesis protein ThiI